MKVKLFASEKEFPELVNPVQMAVRHQGPAVGGGLADLPALEAEGADERQAADPRGHRRRRQGRQAHRVRRRSAQPDRLRVLQRRRASSPRRRTWCSSRTPTATTRPTSEADPARRPRLGRHAPHDQQLHLRSGRRALLPGRDVPPHAGRDAVGPGGAPGQRRRLPLRAADAEVRGLRPDDFANPHGHVFDRWGQDIVVDGTGGQPYHGPVVLRPRRTTRRKHDQGRRRSTSSARGRVAASRSSPAGISPTRCRATCSCSTSSASRASCSYKITEDGAGFDGDRGRADRLQSTDPNFRPVDVEIGPDGALYFVDWQNPIIGHMQHNLRDPSRDREPRPHLPRHLRGPAAAQAGEDRRRADRAAARSAEGAGGPRPLPRQDRAERPQQRRGPDAR